MQTSHSEYRGKYTAGQLIGFDNQVETYISENAADMAIGEYVVKGTAEDQIKRPADAAGITDWEEARGIIIRNQTLEKKIGTGKRVIEDEDPTSVVRKGRVCVLLGGTVTKGAAVFYVHTTGGASTIHTYRADLDTDKAAAIPAVFVEGGGAGEIVPIDINLDMAIADLRFSALGHSHE
jgi:hypothetical protein